MSAEKVCPKNENNITTVKIATTPLLMKKKDALNVVLRTFDTTADVVPTVTAVVVSANALCRCGHKESDHKDAWDEGRPTGHFTCHSYGCVCGKYEPIPDQNADDETETCPDCGNADCDLM